MNEPYLTMAEIEAKYPNEWVLIDRPTTTKFQEVLGGYVIFHGHDRSAIHAKVDELPTPFNVAVRHTGPFNTDEELYLLNVNWNDE